MEVDIAVPDALKMPFQGGGDGDGLLKLHRAAARKAQLDAAVDCNIAVLRHGVLQCKGGLALEGKAALLVALRKNKVIHRVAAQLLLRGEQKLCGLLPLLPGRALLLLHHKFKGGLGVQQAGNVTLAQGVAA